MSPTITVHKIDNKTSFLTRGKGAGGGGGGGGGGVKHLVSVSWYLVVKQV